MAVHFKDKVEYEGAVIGTTEQYHYDGMLDEYAIVWDMEKHTLDMVQFGYYGADGYNFYEASCEVDLTTEVARDIIRTLKREAIFAYCSSVIKEKNAIESGRMAEVIKGRKVQKGTILNIFWVGERPTYQSKMYSFINETEMIAGGYDSDGNKVWIKAEYLKNLTPIKSPSAAERRKFIDDYVLRHTTRMRNVRRVAKGEQ